MNPSTLLVIGVIVIIAFAAIGFLANRRRQNALEQWAASHGFAYTSRDDAYRDLPWGPPFGRGSGRQAQDVLTGTFQSRPAVCFTLRFQTSSGSGENRSTTTHYYAVQSLHLPKSLPELRVGPEGLLGSLARLVGVHDIEFESEEFNRSYKVKSGDRKFASDVINPQMMQFLLDGRAPGFAIIGPDIVSIDRGRLDVGTIESTLGYLTAVLGHVPDFVWKDA